MRFFDVQGALGRGAQPGILAGRGKFVPLGGDVTRFLDPHRNALRKFHASVKIFLSCSLGKILRDRVTNLSHLQSLSHCRWQMT
jgi:hypothetical protein